MSKNIQVAIKVRPLLRKEKDQRLSSSWKIVENSIQLNESQSEPFVFDHIFDQDASNETIFNTMAKQIVHSVVKGINGTIFAYGQTSSGKTYTMMGDEQNPGVMVLAAQEIFKEIDRASDRQFLLRVGYIEIYNERIYDLLNKKNQDLKIHETQSGNVVVNCEECIITCEDDLLNYLCMGNKERTVGETNMNERSSRSHAIFRIIIESRKIDRSEDDSVNQSVLNLVDLAGSERADQTGARGARLKEGGHINKSLLFLSNVIKTLSENDNDKYISFRDSKLTRILQASLGGNALTAIICTIKPTAVEETQSTLNFAMRAKIVKNKPQVNEILSEAAMMKRLESEVSRLTSLLAQERSKNESQIKVVQLEQRIKTELLKIISSNSLHNVKGKKDKRRRTWCPATTQVETNNSRLNSDDSLLAGVAPVPARPTRLQLPKATNYFTPQIGLRAIASFEHQPDIEEEEFQPAELCSFVMSSPQISPNDKWNDCKTPKLSNGKFSNVSITPTVAENVHTHLELVKNELMQLEEFTQLESKLEIKHDVYDSIKQRFELISERNVFLEGERLEYIELIEEHKSTVQKLNDCQKGCEELQAQSAYLSDLNRIANEKITSYEKQFNELKLKIEQLEMENREVVSLDYEFQTHKNKSRLRETELLDVISEKDREIDKLEKTLHANAEEQFKNSKEDLLQMSRFINAAAASAANADSSDENTEKVCVKCEDMQRLLEENTKVTLAFEKLTSEYEKLQLNFAAVTNDATNSQIKLADLELKHTQDMEECEKLRTEICVLREKLEQTQADYIKLNCDNQAKTEAYDALNQEIQHAHEEMLQLQEKYNRLEGVWKSQENTINEIQTEYDAIQLKYQNLQFQYEKLEKTSVQTMEDCTRLQLENENLQMEINVLKVRVEDAQQKLLDDAAIENVNLKKTNEKLQVELTNLQKQFDDMQKEYDDLSNQLMDNLQEADTLKEQNNKFEKELIELRKQTQVLDSVQKNNPELITKIENLSEENQQLQHSILKLQQDNELLSTENKTIVESTERTIAEMREQITKLSAELFEKSMFVENCACEDYKKQIEVLIKERADFTTQFSGFVHSGIDDTLFSALDSEYEKEVELRLGAIDMESTAKTLENEQETDNAKMNDTLVDAELLVDPLESKDTQKNDASMLLQNTSQDVKENIKSDSMQKDKKRMSFVSSLEHEVDVALLKLNQTLDENCDASILLQNTSLDVQEHIKSGAINKDRVSLPSSSEQEVSFSKINQTLDEQDTKQLIDPLKTVVTALNDTLSDEDEIEQLNEIIKDLENTVENLTNQLASKQQDYELKLEENIALQNSCAAAQQQHETARLEHEHKIQELMEKYQENGALQQIDALRVAHKQEIQEIQQKLAVDFKAQLDDKEKAYKDECNRLELEFYQKLELNESEFRENLRKYNHDWQDSKDNFEKIIASLEEKTAQCKCTSIEQEKHELQTKFEKEIQQLQENLKNVASTLEKANQETVEAKNLLEIELSTKVAVIADLEQRLSILEEERNSLLSAQKDINEKVQHENAENMEKLLELQQTNAKLLEECKLLEKAKGENKEIDKQRYQLEIEVSKKNAEINELQQRLRILEAERKQLLVLQDEINKKAQLENAENEAKLLQLEQIYAKLLEEHNALEKIKDDDLKEKLLLQEYAEALSLKFNELLKINVHETPMAHTVGKFTSSDQLQQELALIDEIIEKQKQSLQSKESQNHEKNLNLICKINELENLNVQLNAEQARTRDELKAQLKTIECMLAIQHQLEGDIKSLQAEKLQLQTTLKALQSELVELQQNLTRCIEEKQQLEFVKSKLVDEKQLLEQQLHDLDKNDTERERILSDLREQVKNFEILNSENEKLKKEIATLRKDYEQNLTSLNQDNAKLQTTLNEHKAIHNEMQEKNEVLQLKIETLKQDLDEAKVKAAAYNELLLKHEKLEKLHAKTQAEHLALTNEIEQLQQKLQNTQKSQKDEAVKALELKNKLQVQEAQKAAATEKQIDLCQQLADLKEILCLEQTTFQRETKELKSNVDELQFKCRLLDECNVRLQETNKNLEAQLNAIQQKVATCESQSLQLEKLKSEKIELQARIDTAAREASEAKKALCTKDQLKQLNKEYNSLMDTKEDSFQKDKLLLESNIKSLLLEKKTLEEKLLATESAFKKLEIELSSLQKKGGSNDSSPRSRKSLDRIVGENHQLKSMNLNLEDKLASLQQKTLQLDCAERKNRRLSTHDERRRKSLWGSSSDVSVMTDPTDTNCNCVELDRKLKECERKLFIRESQVQTLNMEIKYHPAKTENINLKKRLVDEQEKNRVETLALRKRLQDEQEKCRIEIKKYKQIIVEQKTKAAANATFIKSNTLDDVTKKSALVAHVECQTELKTVDADAQTESDIETALRKLQSKYNDLKNICRSRYTAMKNLQDQVDVLSKEKENSNGNVVFSSLEMGQFNVLKQQCETLKKELNIYKKKYEDAKIILHSRRQEIHSLRAQLDLQLETK